MASIRGSARGMTGILVRNSWFLHHNAPLHMTLSFLRFLAKNQTPVVPQPSYSSDLSPAELFGSTN
jgi:hypothetical protein